MINIIIPNEEYSNVDDETKKALITAGVGSAAAIGTALASRQKQLSAVEQSCGKRPKIGKRKKQAWQECVNRTLPQQRPITQTPQMPEAKKDNKMLYIVGGSILGLGLITLLIYKLKK
jgi:hypothetical protein